VSFFFKSTGRVLDQNRPFEFTHRSFGEYLTARRIVNELADLYAIREKEKEANINGNGKNALIRCASLCGPAPMDLDLLRFIRDEISLRNQERQGSAAGWQEYLAGLIGYLMREGMPMQKIVPRHRYPTEVRMARNAVESLLVLLNACARVSGVLSIVKWPAKTSFGNLISRLRGQRKVKSFSVSLNCLSYLDLHGADLERAGLERADLSGAHLEETFLRGANLDLATLKWVNLKKAKLWNAELRAADLHAANLQGADLQSTNLVEADLSEANLRGADLTGATLQKAYLRGANLKEAILWGTNLSGANLEDASLAGANLELSRFLGAGLEGPDLKKANLKGANLEGADLGNAQHLTQEQLDGACGDEHTKLPDGLTIKRCDKKKTDQKIVGEQKK
jgi:uncharacterized protein YjbI with pentapeptide repeats